MMAYLAELALWMAVPFLLGCLAGALARRKANGKPV